jgi:23S rRNA A1618 N6-methylase RlmF
MIMDTFTQMLITSLKVLSSESVDQLRYLKALGISGNIDELALEFDDVASLAKVKYESQQMTKQQYQWVESLATQLDEMSGVQNEHLWTEKALMSAPQWQKIREHAKACLTAFQG